MTDSHREPAPDGALVRGIGLRRLTANIVNLTVGAGIFVLPASAAAGLGPAAPLAYLTCAALMALVLLCFASAGSRVSLTGGPYAYIGAAFGPFAGFLAGVLYSLTVAFATASVASAFAASLGVLWPPFAAGAGRVLVLITLFGALAGANVRGVAVGARLVETVTVAKLTPLVILIAAGIWFVRPEYLAWSGAPSALQLGRTAIILIYAFVGVEIALVPSGEIAEPSRTVPRAMFLALAFTTTLYLLIQAVAQGLLGPSMATFSAAPLAEAAGRVLGRAGRLLVLIGGTVSMFGYLSGDMLGSPRAYFAMARDGTLPARLAHVHPRYRTPAAAIVTYAMVVTAFAISGTFAQLLILANVAILSLYLLCVLAAGRLQQIGVRGEGEPFTTPGGWLVPVAAAVAILWLLSQATLKEFAIEALVLAVASVAYAVARRRRPAKA